MEATLVILAAGMGSRYGGSKQVDGMGPHNETILEYSLHDAIEAGFKKAVLIIRKDIKEVFEKVIEPKVKDKIKLHYVYQELDALPEWFKTEGRQKPWGTGHAILLTKMVVNDPFMIINADDFYGKESFVQAINIMQREQEEKQHHIITYTLANTISEHGTVSRGICEVEAPAAPSSRLLSIDEHKEVGRHEVVAAIMEGKNSNGDTVVLPGNTKVSMNLFVLNPSIFDHLENKFEEFLKTYDHSSQEEFFLPLALNDMMKEGNIFIDAHHTSANWFGVTYQEDKETVQNTLLRLVMEGKYPQQLFI